MSLDFIHSWKTTFLRFQDFLQRWNSFYFHSPRVVVPGSAIAPPNSSFSCSWQIFETSFQSEHSVLYYSFCKAWNCSFSSACIFLPFYVGSCAYLWSENIFHTGYWTSWFACNPQKILHWTLGHWSQSLLFSFSWWFTFPSFSWQPQKISFYLRCQVLHSNLKAISHFLDSSVCVIETLFNYLVFWRDEHRMVDVVHDFIYRKGYSFLSFYIRRKGC